MRVLAPVHGRSAQRIIGIMLVQPIIFVQNSVKIEFGVDVKNVIIEAEGEKRIARQIRFVKEGKEQSIDLLEDDLVFITNGCLSGIPFADPDNMLDNLFVGRGNCSAHPVGCFEIAAERIRIPIFAMERYLCRYVHHIDGLPDFSALRFTKYNQYDSHIRHGQPDGQYFSTYPRTLRHRF